MIRKLKDGSLSIGGGTYTASDYSIVDYSILMNNDEKFLHGLLENASAKASSASQEIEKTIQCTIRMTVRKERSMPPIWVLLPSVRKIGCGCYWHYKGHSFHSLCPVCSTGDCEYIDPAEIAKAQKNFDRAKFPDKEVSNA